MINYGNRKMKAKEAAIQVTLSNMMEFGYASSEETMFGEMTEAEKSRFAREYTKVYNDLAKKIGSDEVTFEQISNWRVTGG